MSGNGGVVGVLALQGAFREHRRVLDRLGVESREVRLPEQLVGLGGLILPGGESVAIGKLMVEWKLLDAVRDFALSGRPVWGTCAGAILLADRVEERGREIEQPLLDVLAMTARRNAFGRQRESFEADLPILGQETPFRAVFIRAPQLLPRTDDIEVLATVDAEPVFLRKNKILAASFHPELTGDTRLHELFVRLVNEKP